MLSPNYTNCGHFSGIEAKSQLFLLPTIGLPFVRMKLALVALMSTSLVVIAWAAPMEQQHVVREYEDWRHESNDEMIEALKSKSFRTRCRMG